MDWERTYYLNIILNRINYTLVVTVRKKEEKEEKEERVEKVEKVEGKSNSKHKVVTKVVKKVYSSPAEVRMDEKKTLNQFAYPKIYFSIHDFGETFKEIVISCGEELVGVELIAKGEIFSNPVKKHIFRGALSYEAIKHGYSKKQNFSLFAKNQENEKFLQLKGPNGKGEAQMAVQILSVDNNPNNDSSNNSPNQQKQTNEKSNNKNSSNTISISPAKYINGKN